MVPNNDIQIRSLLQYQMLIISYIMHCEQFYIILSMLHIIAKIFITHFMQCIRQLALVEIVNSITL